MDEVVIYTDGGSRGNPGPAAAAFVLLDSGGAQICAEANYIGKATNNEAEYTAVINSLKRAKQYTSGTVKIFSDSELIVRQLNKEYKVKQPHIKELFDECVDLLGGFESWHIRHVRREKNVKADELVNRAMDNKKDIFVSARPGKSKSVKPIRLGVLLSGGGRTMLNILERIKAGDLNAEISVVISSRAKVRGVERAKAAGIEVEIVRKKDYPDIERFSGKIKEILLDAKVDLVVQAGWLCLWRIPDEFENKVMNIHPALLPAFGGKGMWGHNVHEAVLKAGCKVSGCTVHFCTNEYDKGPIIVQRCCAVKDDDDADSLAARVFEQECIAYPDAIRAFAEGRIKIENSKVMVNNSR